jgi:uncharacterized protein
MKRFYPDTILTTFLATESEKDTYDELLALARSRQMGVIAMKTIRYGRQAKLSATELLRYALGLDGVHVAIVGLDSINHLNEDVAVATGFRAMKTAERFEFLRNVSAALAGVVPPWEERGYVDASDVG